MSDMFCYQCQQTAGNKGCVKVGVCGKQPDTARLQDELVIALIRLAEAVQEKGVRTRETDRLLIDGLFTTLTNVNFDNEAIRAFTERVEQQLHRLDGFAAGVVAFICCYLGERVPHWVLDQPDEEDE